ncbi:hypothetical protein IPL68_05485 [Candidatus Saccharibacteria bacterium]|nr:MAG: hypothetical protein IPL68_05485 [Candidatus Saccharibacteria bacterium]
MLACDALAEYSAKTRTEIDFYGIPEQSITVLGVTDVVAAIQASLALKGRRIEDIERTLSGWANGGTGLKEFTASGKPVVLPSSDEGLVDLCIRLTGRDARSLSAERDRLQLQVNNSSATRNTQFKTEGTIRLIAGVDITKYNELIEIFMAKVTRYQGTVALGPMELVLNPYAPSLEAAAS